MARGLAQPWARVHLQEDPTADRVPLRRERDCLTDDVEVAPALGQAALAPIRRAAAVTVHQIHRLTSAVGGMNRGQPATGPLPERGLLASRDGVPELGDRRAAVRSTSVQDRVGPTDCVLNLWALAEPTGPAARRLLAGQLDQRIDARQGDAGDHGAVVGPDPRLGRQGVRNPRPALPLVVERDAGVDHRSTLRQEDIVDRPVEAAGRAHPGHVPAALDDLSFRTREDPTPVDRSAIRAAARLVAVENLEASQHPGALLAAGTEGPATRDPVATIDGHGPSASHHGGAGDDRVPARVNLLDTLVRQTERDELADAVVGHIPADRAGALGEQLNDAYVGQRVSLKTTQLPRDDQPVEAGGMKLLHQRLRQALLALDLVVVAADDRPQRGCGPHRGLSIDIGGQEVFFRNLLHGRECSAGAAEVSRGTVPRRVQGRPFAAETALSTIPGMCATIPVSLAGEATSWRESRL